LHDIKLEELVLYNDKMRLEGCEMAVMSISMIHVSTCDLHSIVHSYLSYCFHS